MSLVGMFAKRIMGKKICLNPENEPSGASRLAMLASRTADRRISSKLNCIKCVTADGVKYERISLKNSPKTNKAVYYIHGGAFVAALHPFYRNLATSLSKAAGDAEVIFLDYSTAPEFKYPTQLSEALRVWREITEELGFKADNIFIGGDSAGANLALAMILRLRDRKEPLPKAGFFISSWADMSASGESYIKNYRKDPLFGNKSKKTEDINDSLREQLIFSEIFSYASELTEEERRSPYVSPVFGEFHCFPPCFFNVGGDEMLLSDTLTIVEKLKSAGVRVELDVARNMFHIFALFKDKLPEARRSYKKMLRFIKEQWTE